MTATMTATTRPASNKVLATPEILEMVLLRTDMRTLLVSAQRVCRDWCDSITQSPFIQKALFFTPIKDCEWGAEEKILNPLLAERFPSIFPAKDPSAMAALVRADASWSKMLAEQPPISALGLFHVLNGVLRDQLEVPVFLSVPSSAHTSTPTLPSTSKASANLAFAGKEEKSRSWMRVCSDGTTF